MIPDAVHHRANKALTAFLLLTLSGVSGVQLAASESPAHFAAGEVLGRPGYIATNDLITVGVSPFGGRVLRFELGGRQLLWTDAAAVAEMRPPTGDGDEMWWFRGRGGAFLWPTPQSHWRRSDSPFRGWPPPPAIERGEMLAVPGAGGLDLHGPSERNPLWRSVGMQASNLLVIPKDQARLRVHATWTNLALYPQNAGQWFIATLPAQRSGVPAEVTWPLRAKALSRFGERGYLQQVGPSDPEMWRPDQAAGLLRATCLGRPGKISSDSDGGWIIWRDPTDGACVALRFTPAKDEGRLPEGWSSVACNMMSREAVEIEAMGPVMDLDAGQRLTMVWELAACRTAGTIRAVAEGGVVAEPAPVITDGRLQGSFGVFVRGKVLVRRAGVEITSVACTPLEALHLDLPLPPGGDPLELVVVGGGGTEFPLMSLP